MNFHCPLVLVTFHILTIFSPELKHRIAVSSSWLHISIYNNGQSKMASSVPRHNGKKCIGTVLFSSTVPKVPVGKVRAAVGNTIYNHNLLL